MFFVENAKMPKQEKEKKSKTKQSKTQNKKKKSKTKQKTKIQNFHNAVFSSSNERSLPFYKKVPQLLEDAQQDCFL